MMQSLLLSKKTLLANHLSSFSAICFYNMFSMHITQKPSWHKQMKKISNLMLQSKLIAKNLKETFNVKHGQHKSAVADCKIGRKDMSDLREWPHFYTWCKPNPLVCATDLGQCMHDLSTGSGLCIEFKAYAALNRLSTLRETAHCLEVCIV